MSARLWPLTTLVFGLVTLLVFVSFNLLPATRAAYAPGEAAADLSAFQRAATTADLNAVFGEPPDSAALAAMDAINTLDVFAFIPAYAVFLIAAALMLAGGRRGLVVWTAIGFALLGAAADIGETLRQLRVTADWANAAAHLPIAPWHWAKYLALGLNALAMAAISLLAAHKRWIYGVIALLPLPCVLAAWMGLADPRLFSAAFALCWIALLPVAVIELVRARGATA